MQFSKEDLIAIANDCAARHGISPITERVFRDWVDEGLVEPATAQGRSGEANQTWLYSNNARAAVEKIMALRSNGARRVGQLAICLWVDRLHVDDDLVKASLQSEYGRLRNQHDRKYPWNYDHRDNSSPSEDDIKKHARKLPPLDPVLAASGLKLPANIMVSIASVFHWGNASNIAPARKPTDLNSYLLNGPSGNLSLLIHSIKCGGALGSRDYIKNSGEEILGRVDIRDIERARALIWWCFDGLAAGERSFSAFGMLPNNRLVAAYRKATNSFLRPDWIIASLGIFTIGAFHLRRVKSADK